MIFNIINILLFILVNFEPVAIILWLLLVLFTCHWYKYTNDKNETNFYGLSDNNNKNIQNICVQDSADLATVMQYNAIIGGVLYFISLFFRLHPLLISIGLYIKTVGIILIVGTMLCIPLYTLTKDKNNNIVLGYSYYLALVPVTMIILKYILF
jgi:hypothetical protein